jgi:DNA-binding GntR family transcriptional regulator
MAILAGAIIASADTDSEASLARRAGVTRVTVRRAIGK